MVANSILRLPQVKSLTGLSRSSIYNGMKEGTFPASIALGPRAIGWRASEIDTWITSRLSTATHR